jgi:two-component system sensor histidine kinase KdpD
VRRSLITAAATALLIVGLSAALVPLRSDLSIATVGLIMVVPVVAAVVAGGYVPGVIAVVFGFLAWDFVFITPYYTLYVGQAENWVALFVYAVVMLLVAQVVSRLQKARTDAQARAREAQRLFELSQLLVGDRSLPELLRIIVGTVHSLFNAAGVALLLPRDDRLQVVASVGDPLEVSDLESTSPATRPMALGTVVGSDAPVRSIALAAAGRPVGVLALSGGPYSRGDLELLQAFANHAAFAVERAQLQAQAMRAEVLEQVEVLRRAMLGSVSHDLRTPLATMKVASSTLLNEVPDETEPHDRRELYELLDGEIDYLTRLVTGLLDLSRYQAGALKLAVTECSALDLVTEAVARMRPSLGDRQVSVLVPDDLPMINADPVLVGQVVVNLIDNAHRHAPAATGLTVEASRAGQNVKISVVDLGPGVPPEERDAIFDGLIREGRAGRPGMGLWICRAFVEAHGGRIWVENSDDPGTRISFTLPSATASSPLRRAG